MKAFEVQYIFCENSLVHFNFLTQIFQYNHNDVLPPGCSVVQQVDWPRRKDHMQQHSGQHLITGEAGLIKLNASLVKYKTYLLFWRVRYSNKRHNSLDFTRKESAISY